MVTVSLRPYHKGLSEVPCLALLVHGDLGLDL